jgi:antitoxin (DNA-binding transcriptional repressor) of toxin-antitoxin stability system
MSEDRPRYSVSSSDAAKNFGALADRVRSAGVEYVVERSGTPIVRILPAAPRPCTLGELAALLRSADGLDPQYVKAVKAGVAAGNRPAVPRDPWER